MSLCYTSIAYALFYCPLGLSIFELFVIQISRVWLFAYVPIYLTWQMTCVRLLEITPVVLGKLRLSREAIGGALKDASDLKWLPDLIDWGRSQLKVVVTYWRRALAALLDILQGSKSNTCSSAVQAIRRVLSAGKWFSCLPVVTNWQF